jgi:hypothetical protein
MRMVHSLVDTVKSKILVPEMITMMSIDWGIGFEGKYGTSYARRIRSVKAVSVSETKFLN